METLPRHFDNLDSSDLITVRSTLRIRVVVEHLRIGKWTCAVHKQSISTICKARRLSILSLRAKGVDYQVDRPEARQRPSNIRVSSPFPCRLALSSHLASRIKANFSVDWRLGPSGSPASPCLSTRSQSRYPSHRRTHLKGAVHAVSGTRLSTQGCRSQWCRKAP